MNTPSSSLMPNYSRLPVTFERGDGVWLWDTAGNRYLDALSGIAVCGLGHAHPNIAQAICEQAHTLIHTSNLYGIAHQQALADKLVQITGMDNVFFANSGAEANEAAIKLARLYGHQRQIDSPTLIVMQGSFHGRTLATLSATGNQKIQQGFSPLVEGFIHVPFNDIAAIEALKENVNIVGVLVEPIQGEGGIVIPDADYLNALRKICDQQNWLLMLDEIQTGNGRTGRWLSCQHNQILPDILTLAKGLGNGVPIGACLARGEAAGLLQAGTHGSTFGGSPLVCRVALAVLETIEQQNLLTNASEQGQYLLQALQTELAHLDDIKHVRGQGLMLGIELAKPCQPLVQQALAQGLLINVTAERVVRLLPPLILQKEQADLLVTRLTRLIRDFLATH